MIESHAPPYVGHHGIEATTQAIETYFYWPYLKKDVHEFVSQCKVYQKFKYDREKPHSLLLLLPILEAPWESIAMDFIFGLRKYLHVNNGIWTIVDRFSKQACFISIKKTIEPYHMAHVFIE